MDLQKIKTEAFDAANQLISLSHIGAGDILAVGCSSSEVAGQKIGTYSNEEIAQAVFDGIYDAAKAAGVFVAAQCCEHLNRALIVEKALANREGLEIVNVLPRPKAGGSFATAAYGSFRHPVAVEHIFADAGMDIGDTLIGMHLKSVAVPVRTDVKCIGNAHVTAARTRAKFIGGERAVYDEKLM